MRGGRTPAARSSLTRDDFALVEGLHEAVHLLLSEQQVEVVLKRREHLSELCTEKPGRGRCELEGYAAVT